LSILLACGLAALAEVEVEEGVLVLNAENFDEVTASKDLVLVEFYAPWCGHCKNLAPHYAKAAAELEPLGISLAKVNADTDENRPLASRFDVKGFPTLKVFRKGAAPTDYEGGRTTDTIVAYMKRQNQPAVSVLNTSADVQALADGKDVVVVAFFDKEDSEEEKKFTAVANALRNTYTFASVTGQPSIATEHGAEGAYSVVLFKPFDEKKNVFTATELETLESSIKKFATPLVDEIGPTNYKTYVDSGLPLAYLFIKATEKDTFIPLITPLAETTRGQISWVWIDGEKFMRHGENLGLSGKTIPAFVIEELSTGLHFVLDESKTVDTETLKDFVSKYISKEIEPTVKSEEIPASNDGPVKVIVRKSFDQIVLDANKHVFVEFYAPWCGHCKTLAPIWEELGTHYALNGDVIIAKIDATANDVEAKYGVRGFPTLKFFPKGENKTPVDYDGGRTKEDFISFIDQHTGSAPAADQKDEL